MDAMGCWLGTCGVSNLPIFRKDRVRAFFINENVSSLTIGPRSSQASGYGDPTGYYYARNVPLQAHYNEYGGIENIKKNLNYKIVCEQFRVDLVPREEGEMGMYGALNKDMALEEWIDEMVQSAVYSKSYQGYEGRVGLWMVREDVYQAVIAAKSDEAPNVTRKLIYDDGRTCLRKMQEHAMFMANAKKIQDDTGDNKAVLEAFKQSMHLLDELANDMGGFGIGPFSALFRNYSICGVHTNFYYQWLNQAFEGGKDHKDEDIVGLLNEMADFRMFSFMMDSMRKGYMPQAGVGHQQGDMGGQVAVAEAVIMAAKKQAKERKIEARENREWERKQKSLAKKAKAAEATK